MSLEPIARLATALFMTGAAITELVQLPVVMEGLALLGYPPYLVWILAPAKLLAVAALVFRPHTDLARAAWVGLFINLAGAVTSMALAGVAPWPDAIVAPAYLLLITVGAVLHERRMRGTSVPGVSSAPLVALLVLLALPGIAGAAEPGASEVPVAEGPVEKASPWLRSQHHGIETSVFWPIFPGLFFQLRGHVDLPVAGGGLIIGSQARIPQRRATEGTFSNTDLQVGWRQHAWLGLHADVLGNVGWGRLRDSTVNGQDYDSLDVEVQALLGWRQDVGPAYIVVQPLGLASVLYRSNPWPIEGEGTRRTEPPIYVGNILIGLRLGGKRAKANASARPPA